MRTLDEYRRAFFLLADGATDQDVAQALGIPLRTINGWRRGAGSVARFRQPGTWKLADPAAYSYLLGIYLGDGCLGFPRPKCPQLRVSLDLRYPHIIDSVAAAVVDVVPTTRANVYRRPEKGLAVVSASSPLWTQVFPQHGPGRKHTRLIALEQWQEQIVDHYTREFLRGLIHSDGCRCVNRFKTKLPSGRVAEYEYARYFFSNLSGDIRGLFCRACDNLGIRWTQSNHRNISIAHRASVALLDSFVGPKA